MFASASQWNKVTRVREAMRNRGVQKPEPVTALGMSKSFKPTLYPSKKRISFSNGCNILKNLTASFVPFLSRIEVTISVNDDRSKSLLKSILTISLLLIKCLSSKQSKNAVLKILNVREVLL
ncbi:uncharacterized protein LOC131238905 [Magnolia sinica]|uniref:uncharacterized protein LOC131238905 n=1 Tax=Magnolia sinica TaxID=86752 RepID=UPI0026592AC1|nr:uncharacterized protein LOC131238905 [Magnolia sinica]